MSQLHICKAMGSVYDGALRLVAALIDTGACLVGHGVEGSACANLAEARMVKVRLWKALQGQQEELQEEQWRQQWVR